MNHNPYAAPQSQVELPTSPNGDMLDPPMERGIGAAFSWLSKGWALFMAAPGIWILMGLIFIFGYLIVAFLPFVGGIAAAILMPMMLAGLYVAADKLNFGEGASIGDLFEGFSRQPAQLALIGVASILMQLVLVVILIIPVLLLVFAAGAASGGGSEPGPMVIVGIAVIVLIAMAGSYVIGLATWFPPMMVAIHNMETVPAIKLSYAGGMRNLGATIVFGLLAVLLMFVGVLTVGLGLLVVVPWLAAASYAAYREIFFGD